MIKMRTRLCLKDIYRYIVTGESVSILGINSWTATKDKIHVKYENFSIKHYKAKTEEDRKLAIKTINKYISEVH